MPRVYAFFEFANLALRDLKTDSLKNDFLVYLLLLDLGSCLVVRRKQVNEALTSVLQLPLEPF